MFSIAKFRALFLLCSFSMVITFAVYSPVTVAATASAFASGCTQLSPEIMNELKDFVNLIPTATIDELVAKHYITDGNFRKALSFLRSSAFTQLLQQAQEVPEVVDILNFLHLLVEPNMHKVGDTCEAHQLEDEDDMLLNEAQPTEVQFVLLEESILAHTTSTPPTPYRVGTFTSFIEELTQHLPRDKYVAMINAKRQKSIGFAKFYTSLRSTQLRPMVDTAMQSKNVNEFIKTLNSHDIDVKALEPIGFEVLSWGPPL